MGEVWRADDLVLETPVALKLIYSTDPEGGSASSTRCGSRGRLRIPAVCRVFDVGEGEGEVFYSMELVHGEDLATLVRRLGRLPSEKVVDIGQQLCDGLAAAHAQGVLHRDLKPANVLIDDDGFVRITDFGIAVTRDDDRAPHAVIGTPGYMAPEQLRSGRAAVGANRYLRARPDSLRAPRRPAGVRGPTRSATGSLRSRRRSSDDVDPQLERPS